MPSPMLTRREFAARAALGAMALGMPRLTGAFEADHLLYVGTYTSDDGSKGIYQLRMSGVTGALTIEGLAVETASPSYLTLSANERFVYAVNEVGEIGGKPTGSVSAFARDMSTGTLRLLGTQLTNGAAPCYVSTDGTRAYVFAANYTGGSVVAYPILPNGGIGGETSFVQHVGKGPDAQRQSSPHAHSIVPDPSNRFVLVADLGIDRIVVYRFDAKQGSLTPVPASNGVLAAGAGPRHLVFHANGRVVYVVNELNSTVTAFAYKPASGALTEFQTLPCISSATTVKNAPADIHIHPSGRFLYLSNRGHDSISVFGIDAATAMLRPIEVVPTGGTWPRNFAIDPRGEFLLVANQRSDSITSFRIDKQTGRLSSTGQQISMKAPVCIRFVIASA